MTTAPQATEGFIATEVIRAWKSSSDIRTEFGSLARYSAFVQGIRSGRICDRRGKHRAVLPESVPHAEVEKPALPAPAPFRPAPMSSVSIPLRAVVQPGRTPVALPDMTRPHAIGYWLSERYKLHFSQSSARGLGHGDACMEARRLVELDRQFLRVH